MYSEQVFYTAIRCSIDFSVPPSSLSVFPSLGTGGESPVFHSLFSFFFLVNYLFQYHPFFMGATLSRSDVAAMNVSSSTSGDGTSMVLIGSTLMPGYPYDSLATGFVTVRLDYSIRYVTEADSRLLL